MVIEKLMALDKELSRWSPSGDGRKCRRKFVDAIDHSFFHGADRRDSAQERWSLWTALSFLSCGSVLSNL